MSNNKMLIDATHPEETRVVVLRENRVEEFDYESAARKLLRGSIYLAKITRVEPSLQAAFVDYGGNRHGFLAFSEIHPDYYQIPHADRQALIEEELAEQQRLKEADEADEVDDDEPAHAAEPASADTAEPVGEDIGGDDVPDDATGPDQAPGDASALTDAIEAAAIDVTDYLPPETAAPDDTAPVATDTTGTDNAPSIALEAAPDDGNVRRAEIDDSLDETHVHISVDTGHVDDEEDADDAETDDDVESFNDEQADDDDEFQSARGALADSDDDSADDDEDEDDGDAEANEPQRRGRQGKPRAPRPRRRTRHYKIQEVVKRRQIVLIQVVKEERGNKGAALTTYLSLAGRYTVLMPNTARGGGISRKITNVQDRKRLKAIAQELDVPEGMGLIIRTAGAARTKQEIKRDFEYLLRLWENVRNLTLESTAPSLVYEEGNLIKRSIRDLYTKDIDEIIVAGEAAHKEAKGFMKMLMPSHAKNVAMHTDDESLFAKYRIEQQLNAMFSPVVQLRSGGYLVINQTEALVAVDVNSGKSTREFSIEETALNTNLEAAEELSRQLKLRDLAGLIVVDFIDMDEKRNNRAVERKLKDCLRADRARIQVGRISHFGLLEMSRQRLRTGVLEGSTMPCAHCQGSGIVRSTESVSLAVLRGLEDNFLAGKIASCVALCAADVALYLLNQKRGYIQELERRYGVVIHIRSSDRHQGANFAIDTLGEDVERLLPANREAVNIDAGFEPRKADNDDQSDDDAGNGRSRRRRRRGGRRDDERQARRRPDDEAAREPEQAAQSASFDGDEADTDDDARAATGDEENRPRRSRRRGRRGGRRHREQRAQLSGVAVPGAEQPDLDGESTAASPSDAETGADVVTAQAETGTPAHAEGTTPSVEPAASNEGQPESGAEAPAEADQASVAARMESLDVPPAADTAPTTEAAAAPEDAQRPLANGLDTQSDEDTTPAEQPAEPAPAPSDAEAAEDDQPDRAARSQPVAGEPVVQRVVVGPNGAAAADEEAAKTTESAAEPAPQKPARRGWWQRQFGG